MAKPGVGAEEEGEVGEVDLGHHGPGQAVRLVGGSGFIQKTFV